MYEMTGIDEVTQGNEIDTDLTGVLRLIVLQHLEARIEEATRTVEALGATSYYGWRVNEKRAGNQIDKLHAKVETVRWIFRVAKHLNGSAWDQIIMMLCKSVDELEIALEIQIHPVVDAAA